MTTTDFDVVAATKEDRQKTLHHEIAKEHFKRAAFIADHGSALESRAHASHFEAHTTPHRLGVGPRTIANARKKAEDHVDNFNSKLREKFPYGEHGDRSTARAHLKAGIDHANKAGIARLWGGHIPHDGANH